MDSRYILGTRSRSIKVKVERTAPALNKSKQSHHERVQNWQNTVGMWENATTSNKQEKLLHFQGCNNILFFNFIVIARWLKSQSPGNFTQRGTGIVFSASVTETRKWRCLKQRFPNWLCPGQSLTQTRQQYRCLTFCGRTAPFSRRKRSAEQQICQKGIREAKSLGTSGLKSVAEQVSFDELCFESGDCRCCTTDFQHNQKKVGCVAAG